MAALTFADHEAFQRTVLRASAGGAAAGLASFALASVGLPPTGFALLGACVAAAACGTDLKSRALAAVLGAIAGLVPGMFPHHPLFGLAAAGAALGLLFAWHRLRASTAPEVGQPRLGRASIAAAAALCALALVAGAQVVAAFDARQILDGLVPPAVAAAVRGALVAFFLALGSAGAHLARDPDPVEQLYAKLHPELAGDLKVLSARAMTNYRRCAEVLAGSEAGYARTQLARSLSDVTQRILELGRRWQAIDRELGERAETEIKERLAELRALKEATRDDVARRQLAAAEASMNAELEQIDRIRRGRERVVARLHGEMALLERTRFALLGMKSSDAHLRAAELSALSESLSRVAREMDCEAEAVDQIVSKVVGVTDEPAPTTEAERVRG